ncbi:MAG TPA: aminotransferase [Geobacteraceae bacterium]|nr:aminotransferase [Geobacteraceae bacterium]
MKFAVSPLISAVHYPPISEVRQWAAELAGNPEAPLIDLCQAVPDYAPAGELTAYMSNVVSEPQTARYTPDEGLPGAREAIARRYQRIYGAEISAGNICLTVGASQAFWLAMTVLCKAGDEVVVQTPYYFDHDMGLAMLGIKRVYAPFDPAGGGFPSLAAISRLITPRTRAILLVTPSNPTGVVTPPEILEGLYRLAAERGIALVLDETYADFIPGNDPPHHLFTDPEWGDHLVQIMSFGKTYSLTGFRAGLLAGSNELIHHALKAQDTMVVCQPRITQLALQFATEHLDDWVVANCAAMDRRHRRFREEFSLPGNPFTLVASGSFFGWVKHPFPGLTGREAARRLVEEAGLLTLPGEVFGPGMEGYLRLALGNIGEEAIPAAVERLRTVAA